MKKIIIIMGIFTLFNCKDNKYYPSNSKFQTIETDFKIKSDIAINIYEENFEKIFETKRDSNFLNFYNKVIYIQKQNYFIGCASKMDKRGNENPHLDYLAKIDSNTGEISTVK